MHNPGDGNSVSVEHSVSPGWRTDERPLPSEQLLVEGAAQLNIAGEQISPDKLSGQHFVGRRFGQRRQGRKLIDRQCRTEDH